MQRRTETAVGVLAGKEWKTVPCRLPNRTCSEEGCETILSIYNDNDYCCNHSFVRGLYISPRPRQAPK